MTDMTLEEIKQKRKEFETNIENMINRFSEETGLFVDDIKIDRFYSTFNLGKEVLTVSIETSIPRI